MDTEQKQKMYFIIGTPMMASSLNKLKNQKGFTLIELIVVIATLAMLFSLVIPNIQKNSSELLTTSRKLRDEIRYIRYMKIAEGKNYRLVFQEHSYILSEGPKRIKEVIIDKDLSINQNFIGSEVFFSYNGAPSSNGGTITITNKNSKRYCKITVVPATGRILLKDKIYNGN